MDRQQRETMLRFARETIQAHLAGDDLPPDPPGLEDAGTVGGAFVTLRKGSILRGCIGQFSAEAGLAATVREMARAALRDPRFRHQPITAAELPELSIEISLLSPMWRTKDPLALEVGVHGILVQRGSCRGCFLPQVAVEQGWTAEEFLSYCCVSKARLPAAAWRDAATEVYLFTAEAFGDHERV
ncbi:MAG: AmmeMemoRadiSam system protein A [Phycisphaerae bacterium]|nr:AmmeMemoRadiSam system protein A [Phycisphaerae bacterium]